MLSVGSHVVMLWHVFIDLGKLSFVVLYPNITSVHKIAQFRMPPGQSGLMNFLGSVSVVYKTGPHLGCYCRCYCPISSLTSCTDGRLKQSPTLLCVVCVCVCVCVCACVRACVHVCVICIYLTLSSVLFSFNSPMPHIYLSS